MKVLPVADDPCMNASNEKCVYLVYTLEEEPFLTGKLSGCGRGERCIGQFLVNLDPVEEGKGRDKLPSSRRIHDQAVNKYYCNSSTRS
jgi:hypothetical protein